MRSLLDRLSLKAVKRLIVLVIGLTILLIGVVLSIPGVPGPGFLVIIGGLALLATEFLWARHLLHKMKSTAISVANRVSGKPAQAGVAEADPPGKEGSDGIPQSGRAAK